MAMSAEERDFVSNLASQIAALYGSISGGVPDGDKGDVEVSGSGTVWQVTDGSHHGHTMSQITDFPTLGSAAYKNVGATSGTVCAGDDGRLSNARIPVDGYKNYVSVKLFGVVGNGIADDTSRIQDAFDSARVNHHSLFFPNGEYYVTASINATVLTTSGYEGISIVGENSGYTRIIGNLSSSYPILDFTGSQRTNIKGLTIIGHTSGSQTCAILFARDSVTGRGDIPYISDVNTTGTFSKFAIANVSADLSTIENCVLYSTSKVLLLAATNVEGVSSAYRSFSVITGNTLHRISDSSFLCQGNAASAIRFDAGAALNIDSVYFSLQASSGVQSSIEITGTGGKRINAVNVRQEYSGAADYRFVTLTGSSTSGFVTGDINIPSGSALFYIPSGQSMVGYYCNIIMSDSSGRLFCGGGGDLRKSTIINSQGISATLGSDTYGNMVYQGGGTPWTMPVGYANNLYYHENITNFYTLLSNVKLSNLTSNGFLKTSGGDGTLAVDTNSYVQDSTSLAYAVAL